MWVWVLQFYKKTEQIQVYFLIRGAVYLSLKFSPLFSGFKMIHHWTEFDDWFAKITDNNSNINISIAAINSARWIGLN